MGHRGSDDVRVSEDRRGQAEAAAVGAQQRLRAELRGAVERLGEQRAVVLRCGEAGREPVHDARRGEQHVGDVGPSRGLEDVRGPDRAVLEIELRLLGAQPDVRVRGQVPDGARAPQDPLELAQVPDVGPVDPKSLRGRGIREMLTSAGGRSCRLTRTSRPRPSSARTRYAPIAPAPPVTTAGRCVSNRAMRTARLPGEAYISGGSPTKPSAVTVSHSCAPTYG